MRVILVIGLAAALLTGCGAAPGRGLQVVAAESAWGSIAAQLAGRRAHVTSIVTSPALDPHDYEPTAADARAVARARLVIVNGAGYDPWLAKLVAASPYRGRIVLDVGKLVGVRTGGNPHRWYSPADVRRVIEAIAVDYARLDPAHAASFRARERAYLTRGLARYDAALVAIRRRYAGVPIGASESIVAPLAQALRLRLLTPASFLKAIGEGTEPSAADIGSIQRQIARGEIAVWIENTQNSTPDVQRLTSAAQRMNIPVVRVTETIAGPTFQAWQTAQLAALARALHEATGR